LQCNHVTPFHGQRHCPACSHKDQVCSFCGEPFSKPPTQGSGPEDYGFSCR
jgi:hypothetical protein